ncbi:hypothetical protein QR680_014568 [Steinernema hermaphroditum]|uniref:Uncharacterized protein n=1 Tax=Steinernema hermaphroditum TaxID=289476 RepID=A0AA39I9C1_9BILA|nr:hypothetical protein QR680_014568 [Steinernema hermaphroditum]
MFSCDEFWNEMIVKTNKEFHSSMQWFFEKRPKGDKRIETYMDYFERRDENWMLKAHMNSERLTLVAYSAVYNPVLDKYLMLERSCYCICRQCNVTKRYMANTGKKTDFCCMEVGENRGESSSTELISSFKGKFKGQDEKAQYSCITKNPRVEEIIMHHAKPNNQKIESLTVNNFLNLFKNICTDLNAEFFGTASSLNGSLVDRYLPSCVLNRIFKNIGDLENLKKGKGRAVAEKNDQNNSDAQNSAEDDKLEDDKSDQTNRIIPYRKMDDSQDKFRFDRIWQPADRNITGTVDKLIGIFEGKMDELEIWDVEFESRKITLEKLIAIAQKLESMQDDVKRKGLQQSTGEGQTKIEQHFTKQWEENSTTLSRVAENITELINETELKDDGASSKRISAAFQKLRHFRGENKFNFLGEQRYTSLFLELLRDVIEARQVNMLSSFSKSSEINVFVHKTHENKYGQHVWIPYSVEAKDEGVASSWEAIIKNPRKTLFLKQKDCFNFKLVEWDVAIDVVMESLTSSQHLDDDTTVVQTWGPQNLERPWKEKRRTLPRPFKRAEEEGQENAKIEARLDSTLKPLDDADKDELDYEEEPHSRTPDTSTESRTTSLDAEEPCF